MRRPFSVNVPGGHLAGEWAGAGDPVVVLHGGPGLSDYTGALADELAVEYAVYRYQQRGLEPSIRHGPFDVETHVADVKAVMDGMGLEKAFLVGHSWGGHLALFVALDAPQRVRGMVILDALGAVGDGGVSDMGRNLKERLPPEAARYMDEQDERGAKNETPEDPLWRLRLLWPGYFADPASAPPMPDLRTSSTSHSQTFDAIRRHFEARTLETSLGRLDVPCVFVLGADSPIPPIHGRRSAALIPGARVVELPDCGHFAWIERPGSVLSAIGEIAARG